MHRDKKVGLALGVLLIGTVAAFFFRNEKMEKIAQDETPKLNDPGSLDARIAERPNAPYLPRAVKPSNVRNAATGGSKRAATDSSLTTPFRSDDEPAGAPERRVPDPRPIPDHNRDWEPVRRGQPKAGRDRTERPHRDENSVTAYRVRGGDTLSGLALRFLGSSTRYRAIFDANRDQLKTPHDLRTGMTLRIPVVRQASGGSRKKDDTASRRNSSVPTTDNSRFQPVARSPFTRAADDPFKDAPRKRLSQRPPRDRN